VSPKFNRAGFKILMFKNDFAEISPKLFGRESFAPKPVKTPSLI